MSHHHNDKDSENYRDFSAQSYLRLLSYVKPYKMRLFIGILAGMMVGSSLFFCMLVVPKIVGTVEPGLSDKLSGNKLSTEQAELITATLQKTPAEKQAETLKKFLEPPPDKDPKLTSLINDAKSAIKRYGLPISINGSRVIIHHPKHYEFDIVSNGGKIAWQLFTIYAFVFVFFWAFKCAAHYINGYCTRYVGSRVVADLRSQIFHKLSRQSMSFYNQSSTDIGQLISRCTNDTMALEHAVSNSIEDLTNAPLQIIGCLAAIFVACRQYHSYALVISLVIVVPILVIPLHFLGRTIRKNYKKSFARIADVFSRMHEVFSCIQVVKAFNMEKNECQRFDGINNRYFKQVIRAMRLHIAVSPVMEFLSVSATLVFLLYSYNRGITITELTALLAPVLMAYRPIKDVSKVVGTIQQAMAAADRFFALLDTDTSLPETESPVEFNDFKSSIKFSNVSFSYGDKTILKNISFELPKGKMYAVVGETGSGKSTIANLLARLYDTTSGEIDIDGINIKQYSQSSLHKMIGVVTQEPMLFNESIAFNIAYGKPNATNEEIINAAKLANAHDFIMSESHPQNYETPVGEKGSRLSGGEKQRVAIARAILCNPPILILDEATSALDTVTEKLVQDAVNHVMKNRTVFVIAHRLSTIKNADKILVLRHGEIAEFGNESELLQIKNGIYSTLHATQYNDQRN